MGDFDKKAWSKDYMAEYRQRPGNPERAAAHNKLWRKTNRGKYMVQKQAAKRRGIDWLFTFDQWWKLWEPFWDRRGIGSNCLCMARFNDIGPYAPDNVKIITNSENSAEALENCNV